ncbi:MAG: glutamine synthetase type III [Spirochaetia bacterium]|nr:glutamine synthetase type III [Spirochaetia bacterium]
MQKITDYFGSLVFGDDAMKERLPKDVYTALKNTIREGKEIDLNIANSVAHAMKEWALENGATHFTHWFQPLTGITAEKHDSFINPAKDGKVILSFSGKNLVTGEPDASSFPSGGLRATFEARGYTAWDPTSYAFIKEETLCIPTAFCSYSGAVLDKKTPLLRSMEAIDKQAKRILKLFGHDVNRVQTTVGPEQEYFLIDRDLYNKRIDLKYTGRTLLGARAPKGQELDDHYFGSLKPRVSAYMQELDKELWKLGIYAKTRHNEVSPAQHELAPVFTTTNVACDHNQLTMEIMKKVADKHNLVCLLHEKPFAGVNGSGKHNNWSISTDTNMNLLEPGDNPKDNAQFLLFLVAVIKAVDEYQDLLRASVASPGNDHRLGANEAPPAIVSMFIGSDLLEILEAIADGRKLDDKKKENMILGVDVLPDFVKDATDRNRTSPFAFTGNKFELRMLGSSSSVSTPNTVLNTAVAKILQEFADELEKADDFTIELSKLVKSTYEKHKRIVFNGNNYSAEWVEEAQARGLSNLKTTVQAIGAYTNKKNIELYEQFKVLSAAELYSRATVLYEHYSKTINIEALTLTDMVRQMIIPACNKYLNNLAGEVAEIKSVLPTIDLKSQLGLIETISQLLNCLSEKVYLIEEELIKARAIEDENKQAVFYQDRIFPIMSEIRSFADELELIVDKDCWPIPTYGELLYSV